MVFVGFGVSDVESCHNNFCSIAVHVCNTYAHTILVYPSANVWAIGFRHGSIKTRGLAS